LGERLQVFTTLSELNSRAWLLCLETSTPYLPLECGVFKITWYFKGINSGKSAIRMITLMAEETFFKKFPVAQRSGFLENISAASDEQARK
jgi:hypothetical protein